MSGGSFVFDSEALSQLLRGEEKAFKRLDLARGIRARVVISALTIPEADDHRVRNERLDYVLSRLEVEPVTEAIARHATQLLRGHGMHGHKYAIDAVVAATALRLPRPVVIYTSDLDDLWRLSSEPELPKEEQIKVIKA